MGKTQTSSSPSNASTPPAVAKNDTASVQPSKFKIGTHTQHISIREMMQSKKEEKEQKETLLAQISANTPFTQEMMISAWNRYIRNIDSGRQVLKNTMESCKPTIEGDTMLVQTVANSFQENEMLNERVDLLNFLRVELKNGKIDITIKLCEISEAERILSPKEKLNLMIESHPRLGDFVKEFSLELDS